LPLTGDGIEVFHVSRDVAHIAIAPDDREGLRRQLWNEHGGVREDIELLPIAGADRGDLPLTVIREIGQRHVDRTGNAAVEISLPQRPVALAKHDGHFSCRNEAQRDVGVAVPVHIRREET
jgi:hypothetical protein